MEIEIFTVDAFAEKVFEGNPAAVCPLRSWLPDHLMQAIARENNLSETAFFVPAGALSGPVQGAPWNYHIRWFTPTKEVKLCGHATLASASVIFEHLGFQGNVIEFFSLSGLLRVARQGPRGSYEMDLPNQAPARCEAPENLLKAFSLTQAECWKNDDYLLILEDADWVAAARPNMEWLKRLDLRGVGISAPGGGLSGNQGFDFVTRFFAPNYGIEEDPVTGSGFTQFAPYWAKRLGKNHLQAKQVSSRGGVVGCRVTSDRVYLTGKAVLYLRGTIRL